MVVVETTTIRIRKATQVRLAREAEIAESSLVDMLDAAVDLWEERRLLNSMDESYKKFGDEIHAEMKPWLDLPDGWPDDED